MTSPHPKANDSPYGFIVQTGRYSGAAQISSGDNSLWLMGNPDWVRSIIRRTSLPPPQRPRLAVRWGLVRSRSVPDVPTPLMTSSHSKATLSLRRGGDVDVAMEIMGKTLRWWREGIKDMWNIVAVGGGVGNPGP